MSLLLFPLLLPLLSASVFLSEDLFQYHLLNTDSFWFVLILVFDLVMFVLGVTLFEFAVKE